MGFRGGSLGAEEKKQMINRFGRHINAAQVRFLKAGHLDLVETQRRGVTFVEAYSGRTIIDCFTSAGSFNVGRLNPVVVAALHEALADGADMGTPGRPSEAKDGLARRLAELAPGDLDHVLFASGGGEAVDAALKLARGATGRGGVIATIKAYHGHTGFGLSANGKAHYRHYAEPLMPGFEFVPYNDLAAVADSMNEHTAAVIVEPVQGEAGIFPGTDEYLRGLRELTARHGAMLIFDEVQTGFGRTGKLFAAEHSGVVPDIMVLAKSIAGSVYANAAVVYRDERRLNEFTAHHPRFHETLGGGTEIGCRVSRAVVEWIVRERLWENAERMGRRLRSALEEIRARDTSVIREVRGLGLMVGIEYAHEFMGPMMAEALARNGVLAAYSGNAPQVMRFMPPLTIDDAEMDTLIAGIEGAVAHMKRMLPFALAAAKFPPLLTLLNSEGVQTSLFGGLRRLEELRDKLLLRG